MGVSFAFLGHLLTDQLANPVGPFTYFFTYRAMKGFRRREIVHVPWDDLRADLLRTAISRAVLGIFNPRFRAWKYLTILAAEFDLPEALPIQEV